jgi:hypothetical protein
MSRKLHGDGQQGDTGEESPDVRTLVEVFTTDVEFVAQMIIDELLRPHGVYGTLHDRRSHSVPAPAAMAGTLGVAVPQHEAKKARQLLHQAQHDKVLLDDGHIVGETGA